MRELRATTNKPSLNVLRIQLMLNLCWMKRERKQKPHHQMLKKWCGQKRTSFLLTQSHRIIWDIEREKKIKTKKRFDCSIYSFIVVRWAVHREQLEHLLNLFDVIWLKENKSTEHQHLVWASTTQAPAIMEHSSIHKVNQ